MLFFFATWESCRNIWVNKDALLHCTTQAGQRGVCHCHLPFAKKKENLRKRKEVLVTVFLAPWCSFLLSIIFCFTSSIHAFFNGFPFVNILWIMPATDIALQENVWIWMAFAFKEVVFTFKTFHKKLNGRDDDEKEIASLLKPGTIEKMIMIPSGPGNMKS